MGVTSISDSFGITVAAAVAIPVHNYLCTLPKWLPARVIWCQ